MQHNPPWLVSVPECVHAHSCMTLQFMMPADSDGDDQQPLHTFEDSQLGVSSLNMIEMRDCSQAAGNRTRQLLR